jgi:Domain of unknown function (DUF1902)
LGWPHRNGFQSLQGNAARNCGLGECVDEDKDENGKVWFSFASLGRKCYEALMKQNFKVTAIWDSEAEVFTSTSNIPGLVVEAETFEEFVSLVEVLAPAMLEANMPTVQRTDLMLECCFSNSCFIVRPAFTPTQAQMFD